MNTARKLFNYLLLAYSIIFVAILFGGAVYAGSRSGDYIYALIIIPFLLYFVFRFIDRTKTKRAFLAYSFVMISLMNITAFKGAGSNPQLISAALFFPVTVFFWIEAIPRRKKSEDEKVAVGKIKKAKVEKVTKAIPVNLEKEYPPDRYGRNFDIDRRMFLKLIGSAGISMFMLAIFTKKAQGAFFGSVPGPGTVAIKNSAGIQIDPATDHPTDGYNITEIDDATLPSYFGFVNKDSAWYIMREDSSGAYRYAKGSTLFSTNWTGRAALTYDYFDSVF